MGQARAGRKHLRAIDWRALWITEIRRAVLWIPVGLGLGIWIFFALEREPDPRFALIVIAPLLVLISGLAWRGGLIVLALTLVAFSVSLGFSAALLHAHRVQAPVLFSQMVETVEGRVIGVSRSQAGAPRLLMDRVVIYGIEADRTPTRIRVSLRAEDDVPAPGDRFMVYARISPPSGPVEPGGFDFRQRAYFEGLGAVGYAIGVAVPVRGAAPSSMLDATGLWLTEQRLTLANWLREVVPGPSGAFTAAIIVGDRSGIDEMDADALRAANLSHLLAISGLHMGILTGLVFVSVRIALTLLPRVALRISTKKLAALAALLVGACYLAMSGTTVATQRAFIMVAVALIAVQLDRPAISLRALAVAACIVLLIRPVSLLDVGFQMSFAATTALVAGYDALRGFSRRRRDAGRKARAARHPAIAFAVGFARMIALYAGGVVMTSLLAGLATAPYSAFHFNRMAPYGLPANLAAVPVMGMWVAPWAMISAVLAPFGLAEWGLRAMALGVEWILLVSHEVSSWPGAIAPIGAAPEWVLPAVSLGGLWLALWSGPWRVAGVIPVAAALVVWSMPPERPDVLIASDGRIVGLMSSEGRALDKERAAGFIADRWLSRDGDLSLQAAAWRRPGLSYAKGITRATLTNGHDVVVARGLSVDPATLAATCTDNATLFVFSRTEVSGPCQLYFWRDIRRMGAIALWQDGPGIRVEPSLRPGQRLWSGPG